MKRTITFLFVFAVTVLLAITIYARAKRVNQIPNGNVNSCANCHINVNGGGPRNSFGQLVESKYLTAPGSAGDVIWGPDLANEDPDGDGFTNGVELQDSFGVWTGGSIGDPLMVYLPGDPNSHPPITSVKDEFLPSEFSLEQNYPNPFNPTTTISYSIPISGNNNQHINLSVYDVLGNLVAVLVNETQTAGNYEIQFDARGLSSGVYFYRLTTDYISLVKRMVLMK